VSAKKKWISGGRCYCSSVIATTLGSMENQWPKWLKISGWMLTFLFWSRNIICTRVWFGLCGTARTSQDQISSYFNVGHNGFDNSFDKAAATPSDSSIEFSNRKILSNIIQKACVNGQKTQLWNTRKISTDLYSEPTAF